MYTVSYLSTEGEGRREGMKKREKDGRREEGEIEGGSEGGRGWYAVCTCMIVFVCTCTCRYSVLSIHST